MYPQTKMPMEDPSHTSRVCHEDQDLPYILETRHTPPASRVRGSIEISITPDVDMQVDAESVESSSDVACIGSVMVQISDEEWSFPACMAFNDSFG